jgi:hypothetical protein
MTLTRRSLTFAGLALPLLPGVARADSLAAPTGKVLLTVSGKIAAFNDGTVARFDRQMLEALGLTSVTTTTPWYDGPMTFEGVLMTTLMGAVRASGETAVATALNDYETKIPVEDFTRFGVILALKRNGEYMPVRDKGPLFIVYPFDSDPTLRTQKYYSRSAWQLSRLVFV